MKTKHASEGKKIASKKTVLDANSARLKSLNAFNMANLVPRDPPVGMIPFPFPAPDGTPIYVQVTDSKINHGENLGNDGVFRMFTLNRGVSRIPSAPANSSIEFANLTFYENNLPRLRIGLSTRPSDNLAVGGIAIFDNSGESAVLSINCDSLDPLASGGIGYTVVMKERNHAEVSFAVRPQLSRAIQKNHLHKVETFIQEKFGASRKVIAPFGSIFSAVAILTRLSPTLVDKPQAGSIIEALFNIGTSPSKQATPFMRTITPKKGGNEGTDPSGQGSSASGTSPAPATGGAGYHGVGTSGLNFTDPDSAGGGLETLLSLVLNVAESGGCFVAETPVLLSKSTLPIRSVKDGDAILGYDLNTKRCVEQKVRETMIHKRCKVVKLDFGQEQLICTPIQPFFTGAWTPALKLRAGDKVLRKDGLWQEICSDPRDAGETDVYNLHVKPARTFFVGRSQLLVHNMTQEEKRYWRGLIGE